MSVCFWMDGWWMDGGIDGGFCYCRVYMQWNFYFESSLRKTVLHSQTFISKSEEIERERVTGRWLLMECAAHSLTVSTLCWDYVAISLNGDICCILTSLQATRRKGRNLTRFIHSDMQTSHDNNVLTEGNSRSYSNFYLHPSNISWACLQSTWLGIKFCSRLWSSSGSGRQQHLAWGVHPAAGLEPAPLVHQGTHE